MNTAANTAQVQHAQANLNDQVKGAVQLDNYAGSENFNLFGYELTNVLDDIILVKYVDCNDQGTEILKNGVWVPVNTSTFTWRIGEVLLAGPNCKLVKVGDHVTFPNDKGIAVGNLEIAEHGKVKNSCFLNEDRIFGVCQPKSE
jgi:hypothetical protein